MAELGSLLDTGDKVASIVGAVARLAALWVAIRAGSAVSSEAAIALTALDDPRGPDRLRRTGSASPTTAWCAGLATSSGWRSGGRNVS
jgi:hypothetical protein